MKIRTKLFGLLIFTCLVPLVLVLSILAVEVSGKTANAAEADFKTITHNQAMHIEKFLQERRGDISVLSENTIVRSSKATPEEKQKEMKRIQDAYGVYDDITLIDTNGVVITSTDYNYRGEWLTNEWFKRARDGELVVSDAHVIPNPFKLVIIFAKPIFDENNKISSVLVEQIDMKEIWKITDPTKIGNTGFIFMTNKYGKIISYPDKEKLFEASSAPANCTYTIKTVKQDYGDRLEAYDPFLQNSENSKDCWFIVASQDKAETFELVNTMMIQITSLLVIVGFTSLTFGRSITNKISDPIAALSEQAYNIGKRNFEAVSEIKTGDEIEELSKALNTTSAELKKVDKERKELDEAKTQFLSITSHELRSPMTPMKGQLQQLLEGYLGKLTKEQKQSLNIILRNTSRLEGVISDLLDLSKIEAARLKFNHIKTNLVSPIKRIISELQQYLPEKKIKIVAKIGKLPVIEADPDRVGQVLRNLITNAKKYSPENTTINITVDKMANDLLFVVKDEGYGIQKAHQQKVFEPFFQAEQTIYRKQGGTGLGLVICKGIVESQGGKIWFESEPGKGTTFNFTVPFKPSKEPKPIQFAYRHKTTIDTSENVKQIYLEMLGPLGITQFDKIKENIAESEIIKQIEELLSKEIIDKFEAKQFKTKIHRLLGTNEEEKQHD